MMETNSVSFEQIAVDAGYPVHERARESWRAVFEMLALQKRFAGMTRAQTAREGLSVLCDERPVATLGRIDHAIEHLESLIELLGLARRGVELVISGAIQASCRSAAGRRSDVQFGMLIRCAREIDLARKCADVDGRAEWREEIEDIARRPRSAPCAAFAEHLLAEDAAI